MADIMADIMAGVMCCGVMWCGVLLYSWDGVMWCGVVFRTVFLLVASFTVRQQIAYCSDCIQFFTTIKLRPQAFILEGFLRVPVLI